MTARRNQSAKETGGTRSRLLDEAERQIAAHGLDALRLQDLADALGIRVPSLYAHFASRDDILAAVASRYVTGLAAQFADGSASDAMTTLLRGVRDLVMYFASNPAHVRLTMRDLETPGGRAELALAAEGAGLDSLESGPFREMSRRVRVLLDRGLADGQFRTVDLVGFYRVTFGTLLVSLSWPTDTVVTTLDNPDEVERIVIFMEDVARHYVGARVGTH